MSRPRAKLGFDLDGVLVPDFEISETEPQKSQDIEVMLKARKLIAPIWNPFEALCSSGIEPYIVTSRPARDFQDTQTYVKDWFPEFPIQNLHMRVEDTIASCGEASTFKANVILAQGLNFYLESDINQFIEIRRLTKGKCTIFYASSFLTASLSDRIRLAPISRLS